MFLTHYIPDIHSRRLRSLFYNSFSLSISKFPNEGIEAKILKLSRATSSINNILKTNDNATTLTEKIKLMKISEFDKCGLLNPANRSS